MPTDLKISELFYSIQGESTYAGLPCIFIRLADCNLRCVYCDAKYTYEEKGYTASINELLAYCKKYPDSIIEITGGEPLLQENVYPLMAALLKADRTVLLETNGSVDISQVPEGVATIMDIKCPGSGMDSKMFAKNLKHLKASDQIKYVISSKEDYEWASEHIQKHNLLDADDRAGNILFSPVGGMLDARHLSDWILADQLQVRLQIQLHKSIWPECERGV